MKTCNVEQRKKSAKLFHKNNQQCTHYKNGILIRHLYSDLNKNTLSWWDDVGLILNDYRVSIDWTHPRQAFWDHVHNLAIDIVLETDNEQELNSIRLGGQFSVGVNTRTSGDLVKRGYKVFKLDPLNLGESIGYNPLERATTTPEMQEIAHILIHTANQ
jgi:hypothetical protein